MATVHLPNGDNMTVPDDWDAAAVQAAAKRVMSHPEYKAAPAADPIGQQFPDRAREVPAPLGDNPYTRPIKEFGKGLVSGVASVLDTPANMTRLATRMVDHAQGKPYEDPMPRYGGGVQGLVESYLPAPVAGHGFARGAGELMGGVGAPGGAIGRVGAAAGVLNKTAQIGKEVAKNAGTAAGTAAGSAVGGAAGQAVGGDLGRDIGELVGGSAVPAGAPVVGGVVRNAERGQFLVEDNPNVYDVSTRRMSRDMTTAQERLAAADAAGVTPSMGLIGNKAAAQFEDATAAVPYFGKRAIDARRTQYAEADAAAQEIAAQVRGGPNNAPVYSNQPITQADVGAQTQGYITDLDRSMRDEISAVQENIENNVGSTTPVPARDTISTLNRMRRQPMVLDERQAVQGARAQITPAIVSRSGNVGYRDLKKFRSGLRDRRDGMPPMSQERVQEVYDAATRDMRDAAQTAGMNPAEFDYYQQRSADLYNQREPLAPYVLPTTPNTYPQRNEGQTFGSFFGPSAEKAPGGGVDKIHPHGRNLHNQAELETAFNQVAANAFELKARGRAAGALPAPEAWQPKKVAAWWDSLDDNMKSVYTRGDPALRERMDAVSVVSRMDERRPTRTIPGKGGNTFGASGMSVYGPAVFMGTGNPLSKAGSLAWINSMTGRFADPAHVRRLVTETDTGAQMARGAAESASRAAPAIVNAANPDTFEVDANGRRIINVSRGRR